MTKRLIQFTAGIFSLYGLLFIAFPIETLQFSVQGSISSSSGIIDIRATYGGMSLAAGLILVKLAADEATLQLGLLSVFLLMAGMAGGRMVGILVDGNANTLMYSYLALELLGAALALLLLRAGRTNSEN